MRETEGLSSEHSTPPGPPLHGPSVPLRVPSALLLTRAEQRRIRAAGPSREAREGATLERKLGPKSLI